MMKIPLFLFAAVGALATLRGQTPGPHEPVVLPATPQMEGILEKAQLSVGDTSRLTRVLAKAASGGKIVVGVIGGSITQGAKAGAPERRYPNVVTQWWRANFPKAEVTLVNAGIGATGSNYGALRVARDLLSKNPDFVIVEYSCNDPNLQASANTLEGLVRHILKSPGAPAVLMLFMTKKTGDNAQEWHAKVGAHYHLPMVSFRDGVAPGWKSGELKVEDFLADEVHPNDFGHATAAACVTHALEAIRKKEAPSTESSALPAPLFSADYEFTELQEAETLKPQVNQGWTFREKDKVWHAEDPGSVIEFALKGRSILFMSHVIRGAMGRAEVQVDDLPPKTIDGWFPGTWGGYRNTTVLAEGLDAATTHRVRVKILEEKNAESTGHGFSIYGLGAAGLAGK